MIDASAVAIERDAVYSNRSPALQDDERGFARIIGRGRRRQCKQRR